MKQTVLWIVDAYTASVNSIHSISRFYRRQNSESFWQEYLQNRFAILGLTPSPSQVFLTGRERQYSPAHKARGVPRRASLKLGSPEGGEGGDTLGKEYN